MYEEDRDFTCESCGHENLSVACWVEGEYVTEMCEKCGRDWTLTR